MIICAGSIFLDNISRIDQFPKKPIKVLSKGIDKRLGGSAAVSAFTAKKLGCETKFIGKFGDDDASVFLKNEFKKFSININKSISINYYILPLRCNKLSKRLILYITMIIILNLN